MRSKKFWVYSLLVVIIVLVLLGGIGFIAHKIGLFSPSDVAKVIFQSDNSREIWKLQATNDSRDFTKFALDKDNNSYVFLHNSVEKIDSNGNKICESFNAPDHYAGIAAGLAGVYFSTINGTLVKIDKNCKEIWSSNLVGSAKKIVTDYEDNVYVTDGYNIIAKYSGSNGNKVWEVNLDNTKTVTVGSILFHKEKLHAFAGDEGVMIFDKNGQKVGMADLGSASDGFIDSEDNAYLNEGNGIVSKYDKDWKKLWTVDMSEDFVQQDIDLMKADNLGNIYFTLQLNGCFSCDISLHKIDSQGNKTFVYKDDKNYFIKDLSVDSENNLYITSLSGFGKFSQIKD